MLIVNLVLAVVPALLILRWVYRRDAARPEPRKLVIRAFLLGIAAVILAILVGLLLQPLNGYLQGVGFVAFQAFVIAGFLEEGAKLLVVLFFISRHSEFDEVADGLVYTMAASLGFAAVENILYLGGPASVLIIRGLTAVPLHASVGGLMGYFIGLNRIEGRASVATGLLLAILVHGAYDFFLFMGAPWSYLAIPVVICALVWVRGLFRKAVQLDRAAGRVGTDPGAGFRRMRDGKDGPTGPF